VFAVRLDSVGDAVQVCAVAEPEESAQVNVLTVVLPPVDEEDWVFHFAAATL
jgi:hypothetical protein